MTPPISIVYVEDEPSIAQLLSSGLGLFGMKVHPIYMSAEDLLQNLAAKEIVEADMFIFDIRLPGMTGLELATRLRQKGEARPVLLVSAWPPPSMELLDSIQASFIAKPFDFADIVAKVQELTQ
ncbi:MAG: response regulator [Anaerolineae bacterium]|nr:response regulator [Anaerolineae bacterium]